MFNRIADTYDPLNHGLSLGIDTIWRKKAINIMKIDNKSVVLDVATGTGDIAILALKKNAATVVGIDPAFEMVRKTNQKITAYSGKFHAIEGFGEYLPLKSDFFSHVLISYGIRNVSERNLALSEFYRVLKKNGKLGILEFSKSGLPFFQTIYNVYFRYILTCVGGLISGDREAYEYLPESVSQFPSHEDFIAECLRAGFKLVRFSSGFLGISTFYEFQK